MKRRDGAEAAIEDSAAPIHDRRGKVTGAVMVFHDVTDARALAMKMSHQAQHDILTDLPNRMLLNDRLTHAMAVADRHKQKLAVLFLDIDHFKNVNDTLGHEIGDRLLRMVADQLLGSVRNSDTVSRQGGDEFVIVLSELDDGHDAAIAAEKILQTLSAPFQIEAHELHVSASIGIVIYPDDAREAETLLRHADFAMYHAKDCGRGNFQFFREDMNVRALERRSIESALRVAVEKAQFVLHYQPIVDLWSGATTGIEALLRWQHPIRGLLLPAEFVPVAEESSLIVPIGRWVLGEACRQSRAWQAAGMAPVSIAINISAVELHDKDFVATVRTVLQESGLAPRYLELELTETFLLKDSSATALVLRELKDLGVQLSLDDFGTGYSSFSHLKGFPIDTLKIDRAFVSDVDSNCNDASIVGAVIALGKNLHMRVIAEGVETRAQLTLLQEQACPEGQGFYFGRAVAGEHLPALLNKIQADLHSPDEEASSLSPDEALTGQDLKFPSESRMRRSKSRT
jgi:diguanylate cyclase (GGDEF)-like protein